MQLIFFYMAHNDNIILLDINTFMQNVHILGIKDTAC